MVSQLRLDVIAYLPLKAVMLNIEGAGGANPIIEANYNIDTVVRTGVGVYRITILQATMFGVSIENNGVPNIGNAIQASLSSDAHDIKILTISPTEFDLIVTEIIQGSGNKLEFQPYDIIAGDDVGLTILLTIRNELPPL